MELVIQNMTYGRDWSQGWGEHTILIMDDDNVTSKNRDLENLVQQDISLATEVLKIANSPLYRSANKQGIDNIGKAIIIIGWDTIYKIGMSLTVKGLLKTAKARTFATWMITRAITIANISEVFLESLQAFNNNLSDINSIYAYGLLHDIGAMGLLQVIENYQQDIMEIKLSDDKKNWSDAEQIVYGLDHNRVGEQILIKSQLPISFATVARFHHYPETNKYSSIDAKRIALIRLSQAALVDSHKFSEHEAFCNFVCIEEDHQIRDYQHLSEQLQTEFEEILGINSQIYDEIKTTKLTDDFINNITQQYQNGSF